MEVGTWIQTEKYSGAKRTLGWVVPHPHNSLVFKTEFAVFLDHDREWSQKYTRDHKVYASFTEKGGMWKRKSFHH